jgi:ring-1,2-phenylacetyl-CoA epoxidase subunit PaaC
MTAVSGSSSSEGGSRPDMSDPRLDLLLALADDELVIGHRHALWTGVAPHLEEDLAFSSIAQDEIGHAVIWYGIAAELAGTDPDSLGLGRPPKGYRNAILTERDNGDWGYSIARQYLYDTADDVRLTALADSSWSEVANATGAIRREERYHLMHARTWLDRLSAGPVEARRRLSEGLVAALPDALGLFEPLTGEDALLADGVLPVTHAELLQRWLDIVSADLEQVGLERVLEDGTSPDEGEFVPTSSGEMTTASSGLSGVHVERRDGTWVPVGAFTGRGGRHGRHSEDFAAVWEDLTGTYRAFPGVTW